MIYSVEYSRDSAKFIKKARRSKQLYEYLKKVSQQLENDYRSVSVEPLSGKLRFLQSHHFRAGGVDYRLVFSVEEVRKLIYVWLVGPRENFYRQLLQKFG